MKDKPEKTGKNGDVKAQDSGKEKPEPEDEAMSTSSNSPEIKVYLQVVLTFRYDK